MSDLNNQLLSAANNGDYLEVEKLVAQGADINYTNQWGNFALFTAAWEGNITAMDTYHRLGGHLEFEEANLLCNAAYNGKIDSVRWLLNKGAKGDFTFATTGENALHYTIC